MNKFFTTIFRWFCDPATDAFKYMGRLETDGEILTSMMPALGWTTLAVSVIMTVAFYIWPINHPRFKAWWAWLIMLGTNALINFGLTFAFLHQRIAEIKKNPILMEEYANSNGLFSIALSNKIAFAMGNVCVSILFFFAASLIFMWFDGNCKFSPFRK